MEENILPGTLASPIPCISILLLLVNVPRIQIHLASSHQYKPVPYNRLLIYNPTSGSIFLVEP